MLLINIYIGGNVSIFNSHHLTGNTRLHRSLSSCKPLTLSTHVPVLGVLRYTYSVGAHTYLPHAQHGKNISILKRNFSRATYCQCSFHTYLKTNFKKSMNPKTTSWQQGLTGLAFMSPSS